MTSYRIALFLSIQIIKSGKKSNKCGEIMNWIFQRKLQKKSNFRTCFLTSDAVVCDLNEVSCSLLLTSEIPRIVERIVTEAAVSTSITLHDLRTVRLCTTLYVIDIDSAYPIPVVPVCEMRTGPESRWCNVDDTTTWTPGEHARPVITSTTCRNSETCCCTHKAWQCLSSLTMMLCNFNRFSAASYGQVCTVVKSC